MNMKKMTIKLGVAVAMAACALGAQAAGDFASNAMSLASGFTGGSVSGWTMTVTDGSKLQFVEQDSPDTKNRQSRGWYAGVTIAWPEYMYMSWPVKLYAPYATDGQSRMKTTRMSAESTGEEPGSGNGLTVETDGNDMESTTWWAWITPEEAFAANNGTFQQKLNMYAGRASATRPGVNAADFYVNFDTSKLTLTDPNTGIVWFPAVATNASGKVYGDLNVALEAGGTLGSVADAAITNAITLEAGVVYYKNGKNITGLDNLTLLGGSYDFDPDGVCTIGKGCRAEKVGNLWVVHPCEHNWTFKAEGDTFTATCSYDCGYTPQELTVKIDELTKTYDGKALVASLKYGTSEAEFKAQTGATVGDFVWKVGDAKSVGDHTVSVTITAGGADYEITKTAMITAANLDTATVTLSTTRVNFADAELSTSVSSVTTAAGITGNDWEIVDESALRATGSGYSNCTYTVTLRGKGNYTGTKTATWTIVAPTREFDSDAMGRGDYDVSSKLYNENYGEAVGRELVVTASTNIIFVNGYWWVGMTVELPTDINRLYPSRSLLTDDDNLRVKLSTTGKTYTGTQIYNKQVTDALFQIVDGDHDSQWWSGIGTFQYFKTLRWFTPISPAMIEEALGNGGGDLEFTMTVGGITGRWEGLKYTDFTIKVPVYDFIFKVRENESADIGNVSFTMTKILLKAGSVVTNACAIDYVLEKNVYTDVAGNEILETKVSDTCYVYSSETVADVTIPNVDHQASKVVTLNGVVIDPIDADKTKYRVHEGDTLVITYTAEEGFVPVTAERTMANVTPGATLADLPVFTWAYVYVEPNAPANTTAHVFTNGVEVASPYQVLSNSTVTVWYEAGTLYFFEDGTKSNKVVAATTANPTVPSTEKLPNVGLGMAKIGEKGYFTLTNAFSMVKSGETIELLKDGSGAGIVVNPGTLTDVTVDLGGFAYTCTSPAGYKWPDKGLDIREGNTLTFKNGTLTSVKDSGVIVFAEIYAKVTFDGVTIDGRLVDHYVEFKDGDYVLTNNSGNTILTNSTVIAKDGDFAIDTCKLDGYVPATVVVDYGSSVTGKIAISGGNLTVKKGATIDGSLVIVDGLGEGVVLKHNTVTLAAPALYAWNDVANDMQQLVVAKAMVEGVYYPTLDKALAAAKEDETVSLLCGCSNETSYAVATAITLDENGFAATNVCIAATGTVAVKGATGSANKLRADRPTLFGALENGAKVKTDKTYVYVKAFDAFYEEGHEVVATVDDGKGGTYLESYPKFADGLAVVATNGTVYALMNITNDGFTVKYNVTIDLAKAANGGTEYSLTIDSPARKTIGIEIGRQVSDVTFRGGTVSVGENAGITTFFSSSAANLTLDNVKIDGCAMLNDASVATKTLYALALNEGATTLTNAFVALPRVAKAYALYVSCYGVAKGNTVTFLGANTVTGNALVNVQNAALVEVAFGNLTFDQSYQLTVNAYKDTTGIKTRVTKAQTSAITLAQQSEFSWSDIGGIDQLVFGKVQIVGEEEYYSTLAEAMEEVGSGQTIRLCADVVEETDVDVADGVTLDLNGHTLTMAGEWSEISFYSGMPVKIVGTNENSRLVGYVVSYDGACLSISGGEYDGQIAASGSAKLNIADAIVTREDMNETAVQLGSYGKYGSSRDENLTVTVVNSRITGYSAVYLGGGSLTVSNSVLTAFGSEKLSIDRDNWMGGTGDALVIDQVPGCPISVNIEAGTKLQQQLDIGCEQLGWCTNAQGAVTATVTKRDQVDVIAVDGYWWVGDKGGILTMTNALSSALAGQKLITKNRDDLSGAFKEEGGYLKLDSAASLQFGQEVIEVTPQFKSVGDHEVTFTSIPYFTYELLASDAVNGTYETVDRVRALETQTTLTDPKIGAASRCYKVRLVP